MNQFKLKNIKTGEEHLCDKITIDGFDYYVIEINSEEENVSIGEEIIKLPVRNQIIIAGSNPNIGIPQVVSEVEVLANQKALPHLRAVYIEAYNEAKETHPFSEEDMIEFLNWIGEDNYRFEKWATNKISPKELFQLWKEQKPKVLFYE